MATDFPQPALQGQIYPLVPPLFDLEPNEFVRFSVIDVQTRLHSVPWRVRLLASGELEIAPRGNRVLSTNYLHGLAGASQKVVSIVIPIYSLREGPGFPVEKDAPEPLSLWPSTDDYVAIRFDVWFAPPGAAAALIADHTLGCVARCRLEDGSGILVAASAMVSDAHREFVFSFLTERLRGNLARMTLGNSTTLGDNEKWGRQMIQRVNLDGVLTFVDTKS